MRKSGPGSSQRFIKLKDLTKHFIFNSQVEICYFCSNKEYSRTCFSGTQIHEKTWGGKFIAHNSSLEQN